MERACILLVGSVGTLVGMKGLVCDGTELLLCGLTFGVAEFVGIEELPHRERIVCISLSSGYAELFIHSSFYLLTQVTVIEMGGCTPENAVEGLDTVCPGQKPCSSTKAVTKNLGTDLVLPITGKEGFAKFNKKHIEGERRNSDSIGGDPVSYELVLEGRKDTSDPRFHGNTAFSMRKEVVACLFEFHQNFGCQLTSGDKGGVMKGCVFKGCSGRHSNFLTKGSDDFEVRVRVKRRRGAL